MTIQKPNSDMRACWVSRLPGAERIRASILEPLKGARAREKSSKARDANAPESTEHHDQSASDGANTPGGVDDIPETACGNDASERDR